MSYNDGFRKVKNLLPRKFNSTICTLEFSVPLDKSSKKTLPKMRTILGSKFGTNQFCFFSKGIPYSRPSAKLGEEK